MYKAIWAAIALTMAVSLGSHGKITGRVDDFVQDTNRNEVSASNTNAIAKALGTDPGERNIKYILWGLISTPIDDSSYLLVGVVRTGYCIF